ncbi:pantetheine-phosphate adenylyltransferase [bacterium]|nr:pantetheine-phosphate adenylyltransferase [bacterium]
MKRGVYPGTFDPITYGHLDIIKRALDIFDELIVAIGENPAKNTLFSAEERFNIVREAIEDYPNTKVMMMEGLLAHFADEVQASAIIRGLRALSDFEHEFQMALANRKMNPRTETIFLMPNEKYSYLNSTMVKTIASMGGKVTSFVPKSVEKALKEKYKSKSSKNE